MKLKILLVYIMKRIDLLVKSILPSTIKTKYRNLTTFKKLISFDLALLSTVVSLSLIAIQIALNIYNRQLYIKSMSVLSIFTTSIENDFKEIEELSSNLALDPEIQSQLAKAKNMPDNYDQYKENSNLRDKLLSQSLTKTDLTISYYNLNGKSFTVGNDTLANKDISDSLIQKAKKAKGSYVINQPSRSFQYLTSAREILKYQDLSLEPLGTLIFSYDLDNGVKANYSLLPDDKTQLLIYFNNKMIYPTIDKNVKNLEYVKGQGYTIGVVNGQKCFIASNTSNYLGWTYVSVMPYNNLFKDVTIIRYSLIGVLILLFFASIYFCYKTARNITRPIENLSTSMKKVENGNFQNVRSELHDYERTDEVGSLQKNFLNMIDKINILIKENYEKQLIIKDTEYKALQSQINPHFLYNTLNSINWLAKDGKIEEVSVLVVSLGDLLRASISKQSMVILSDEINLLKCYINIQKMRYEERIDFSLSINEEYLNILVPKMILQPIVENSIKYCVENMLKVCRITVVSYDAGKNVKIVISDNGVGMDIDYLERLRKFEVVTKETGIGLKNIDERCKMLYGDEYGLTIDSEIGKGTSITITIPKRGSFNV